MGASRHSWQYRSSSSIGGSALSSCLFKSEAQWSSSVGSSVGSGAGEGSAAARRPSDALVRRGGGELSSSESSRASGIKSSSSRRVLRRFGSRRTPGPPRFAAAATGRPRSAAAAAANTSGVGSTCVEKCLAATRMHIRARLATAPLSGTSRRETCSVYVGGKGEVSFCTCVSSVSFDVICSYLRE